MFEIDSGMPPTERGERLTRRVRRAATVRVERAAAATLPAPLRRRGRVDVSGWSIPELVAFLAAPRSVTPPLRAGHFAVRLANSLDGALPVEAMLLARAIADAAPPVGQEIGPTLLDIVDRYLPDTLEAFRHSRANSRGGASPEGERLVVEQLRLLHQVTHDVQRAQVEHDDHELRLQDAFLKERFSAQHSRNGLDLSPPPATEVQGVRSHRATPVPGQDSSATPSGLAASQTSPHHRLRVEAMPTAVFHPEPGSEGVLAVRLALPKGLTVTLTAGYETRSGATGFTTARTRRLSARRKQVGFGAPQADVAMVLPLRELRRFVVLATCRSVPDPTDAVLFLNEGVANAAELPTVLFGRSAAVTTLIASGHDTSDGLFLRNESTVFHTVQDAFTAHGFTGVTWLSPDTPAV